MSTKSSFELVFSRSEPTKVILKSKSWCGMFVLKLSGLQIKLLIFKEDERDLKKSDLKNWGMFMRINIEGIYPLAQTTK